MIGRPSLLVMTAVAAGLATVANAVGLAGADEAGAPAKITSRLGVAIADDTSARDQAATRRGRTLDLREQAVRAAEMRLKASAGASRRVGSPTNTRRSSSRRAGRTTRSGFSRPSGSQMPLNSSNAAMIGGGYMRGSSSARAEPSPCSPDSDPPCATASRPAT